MTSKRYHKLFGALMTEIMAGSENAGRCIKAARHAKPLSGSYEENFNNLVNKMAEMGYNYKFLKQHTK